jgi:large subunit ribosomal protein L24
MNRIRKGDQVVVTTGNKKIKGQTGEVLRVDGERVYVSNLNLVKRAHQAEPAGRPGRRPHRARGVDPHFQRDAAQPGHRQGRAHRFQGPGEWTRIRVFRSSGEAHAEE